MRPPTPPSGSRPLSFGCVPHTDDLETRAILGELCRALTDKVRATVRSHRAPSPALLASAFGAGRIDVAWVSPVLLLTAEGMRDAIPLVSAVREGVASYHAVLFTAADSPLRSPSDLVRARAAWVAKTSAAGYLVPRLALAARGLRPDEIFAREEFLDSHGAVARAVLEGEADVGATFAVFEEADPTRPLVAAGFDGVPGGSARVLLSAGPIPADLMVARPDITITQRAALTTAFESLPEDAVASSAALHLFGTDSFRRFESGALDPLREDVQAGRVLGLLGDD